MNIARAYRTSGFMDNTELTYLAEMASQHTSIVEVGTWQGRSACAIADNMTGTLHCVDTWSDDAYGDAPAEITCHKEWLWNAFSENHRDDILKKRVIPVRATSVEGARLCMAHTFDMVFLDAGHHYENLRDDILAWRPLLKPGGLLCGHDMYPDGPYHPGVLQAVNEFIPKWRVIPNTTIWEEVR